MKNSILQSKMVYPEKKKLLDNVKTFEQAISEIATLS